VSAVRKRLAARLLEVGWVVAIDDFGPTVGGARTSRTGDFYRWEAFGCRVGGGPGRIWLTSHDTMTDCARYGVTVGRDTEVHANTPPKPSPGDRRDVTPQSLAASGVRIDRVVARLAYARNGNVGGESVEYRWEVFGKGRLIGTARRFRDAKSLAVLP
jgi:hypothetical protein